MVPYTRGLHEVADGVHAWLLPDGGWGLSNAGLVRSGEASLLVDTLFDLDLTGEMLDAMRGLTTAAPIGTVVNTHANGDHCYGNALVPGAEVVASAAAAKEMDETPPAMLAAMVAAAPQMDPVLGRWITAAFGPYNFAGVELRPPTTTFDGTLSIAVGDRAVELVEVGPAHTAGDVIVHVPDAAVVFTGDIVFHKGTPIMWAGPVDNWIAACDRICSLHPTVVVPGHGPVTDPAGVRETRDYLAFVRDEATTRHAAGMHYLDAANDIDLGPFADLGDKGRIVVNVHNIYRDLDPTMQPENVMTLFTQMAEYEAAR
ncbi:MAG TPA: MBL fold metallo-hydrolase [Acidimicrobiales bacterium]|nr:MBL fold metallo-hydrolase [Acidimicrobiales bacterium]